MSILKGDKFQMILDGVTVSKETAFTFNTRQELIKKAGRDHAWDEYDTSLKGASVDLNLYLDYTEEANISILQNYFNFGVSVPVILKDTSANEERIGFNAFINDLQIEAPVQGVVNCRVKMAVSGAVDYKEKTFEFITEAASPSFTLTGSGSFLVFWGDGTYTAETYGAAADHTYTDEAEQHTVTVLINAYSDITGIDLSGNNVIGDLLLNEGLGNLTSLDVSDNQISVLSTSTNYINTNSFSLNIDSAFSTDALRNANIDLLAGVSTSGSTGRVLTIETIYVETGSDLAVDLVKLDTTDGWTVNTYTIATLFQLTSSAATFDLTVTFPSGTVYIEDGTPTTLTTATPETITGQQTVDIWFTDPTVVTDIQADNASLSGALDLSIFTGLDSFSFIESNFESVDFPTSVTASGFTGDLTNSIIDADRLITTVNNLITANGGTITDDGTSYTGSAGTSTSAGTRFLDLGTITIDISSDPAYAILYEKILALGTPSTAGAGWELTTVDTVCTKTFYYNTEGEDFAAFTLESETWTIGPYASSAGDSITFYLYDTIANARTGTATGREATGLTAINTFLNNGAGYVAGQAIRIEALTGTTGNQGSISVKNKPTTVKPCGIYYPGVIGGNAKIYDGSTDCDTIGTNETFIDYDTPRTFLFSYEYVPILVPSPLFIQQEPIGTSGNFVQIAIRPDKRVLFALVKIVPSERIIIDSTALVKEGENTVQIFYDGSGDASGLIIRVNGVTGQTMTANNPVSNSIISGTVFSEIGRFQASVSDIRYYKGLQRKMQILDSDYSSNSSLINQADENQSYEGLVSDARFLLDPDFNQTGTANLTTRAGTPTYTIPASGGAAYEPYED